MRENHEILPSFRQFWQKNLICFVLVRSECQKPSFAVLFVSARRSFVTRILLQATDSMGSITGDNRTGAPRVRRYHLLPLPGTKRGIRIFLDRLQLLNILDQVLLFIIYLLPVPGTKSGIRIFLDRLQLLNILDQVYYFPQCCGSGSGIRCLFDPWIRDPE